MPDVRKGGSIGLQIAGGRGSGKAGAVLQRHTKHHQEKHPPWKTGQQKQTPERHVVGSDTPTRAASSAVFRKRVDGGSEKPMQEGHQEAALLEEKGEREQRLSARGHVSPRKDERPRRVSHIGKERRAAVARGGGRCVFESHPEETEGGGERKRGIPDRLLCNAGGDFRTGHLFAQEKSQFHGAPSCHRSPVSPEASLHDSWHGIHAGPGPISAGAPARGSDAVVHPFNLSPAGYNQGQKHHQ